MTSVLWRFKRNAIRQLHTIAGVDGQGAFDVLNVHSWLRCHRFVHCCNSFKVVTRGERIHDQCALNSCRQQQETKSKRNSRVSRAAILAWVQQGTEHKQSYRRADQDQPLCNNPSVCELRSEFGRENHRRCRV